MTNTYLIENQLQSCNAPYLPIHCTVTRCLGNDYGLNGLQGKCVAIATAKIFSKAVYHESIAGVHPPTLHSDFVYIARAACFWRRRNPLPFAADIFKCHFTGSINIDPGARA